MLSPASGSTTLLWPWGGYHLRLSGCWLPTLISAMGLLAVCDPGYGFPVLWAHTAWLGPQRQTPLLPHCTPGPGAPPSALAASLPETYWPQLQRMWSLTPGSRAWAPGQALGHQTQPGIPAEETHEHSLNTQAEALQGPGFVSCSLCPPPPLHEPPPTRDLFPVDLGQ